MNYEGNVEDLEKPFSELCTISENEKTFQGNIQWSIPNPGIKKHLECSNKPIQSDTFSIGTPSFCSLYFTFHPDIWNNEHLKSLTVSINFKSKLPDSACVKCEIRFEQLNLQETLNASKKNEKKIEAVIPCNYLDLDKFFYICESGLDFIMCCSLKIIVREVKCTFDKITTSYTKSINYDSRRETFKHYFSDVSISIGSNSLMTHKTVLAQIPYFQELFDANESEKHFELTDISHEIFYQILIYLESGDIPKLSFKLACELYIVAGDFKISDLKSLCSSYLGSNLTVINVLIALKLAHEYEDNILKKECFKFIKRSDAETLTEKAIIL